MEALVMLGKSNFDLIILDVIMPGMDGIQFCRTIRKNPDTTGIKIIAITGKQLSEEQEYYLNVNAMCILKKPFLPSVLLEKVKSMF
jgi:CheY-like chemotaxis protein